MENFQIMQRWLERPYLFVFPAVGAAAALPLLFGARHEGATPVRMAWLIFAAAFLTMAVSFWPDMVPFAVRIDQAAAPPESLSFIFWGAGLFVMPLVLAYNIISYRVFRGKLAHPVAEAATVAHGAAPQRVSPGR